MLDSVVKVKGKERERWREGFGPPKNFGVAPPMKSMGISMDISMDISMGISMDISMDIHGKICGYGCGYGWEISYPRQAWQFHVLQIGPSFSRPAFSVNLLTHAPDVLPAER